MKKIFLGVDVGSTYCKAAVLDESLNLIGSHMVRSGVSFEKASAITSETALKTAGLAIKDVTNCVSTGYGRGNVEFSDKTVSEISCHSKTAFAKYQRALTLVDIGGQDNKVVFINDSGKRTDFIMNRKCAAGTGAFVEEMALRLGIQVDSMDSLARESDKLVQLGSFCTVFAGTETLSLIRAGESVQNIAKGVFYSVLKRVMSLSKLNGTIIMTGGVAAHNPYIVDMLKEMTGSEVFLPDYPQLFGAIGAALYASEIDN